MNGDGSVNPYRMADAYVRTRTALMIATLTALAWVLVTMMGRGAGPYAAGELPDLAGLPILVPQIERLVPPRDIAPDGGIAPGAPTPTPPASEGTP